MRRMLMALAIRDFAIIDDLELEFAPGLTVLSGETGAGKSIIVDALGLALGQRASSSQVRDGARRAEITAIFAPGAGGPAADWCAAQDLEWDETLVLRRTVQADGGSRAWLNGTPVPAQQLADLGALLVDLHGQHGQYRLLQPRGQLDWLDSAGGDPDLRLKVSAAFRDWREAERQLAATLATAERPDELEYLGFQLDELAAVETDLDEYEALVADHHRLSHADELGEFCRAALAALDDDEDAVLARLHEQTSRCTRLVPEVPELKELAALFEEARINLSEATVWLRRFADTLELDPDVLTGLDQRLARLHDLARKHRTEVRELKTRLAELRRRREVLADLDQAIVRCRQQAEAARQTYIDRAAELSAERRARAACLTAAGLTLIRELGMPGADWRIDLESEEEAQWQAHGTDRIALRFSANPGTAPDLLRKIASGGELSRVALAMMVAALQQGGGTGGAPTQIFDEVDAGVGGAAAHAVGRLLKTVGRSRQVLSVTHLAQVASLADHHLRIGKRSDQRHTWTEVTTLSGEARLQELARMLGGKDTPAALAHARELLAAAS